MRPATSTATDSVMFAPKIITNKPLAAPMQAPATRATVAATTRNAFRPDIYKTTEG